MAIRTGERRKESNQEPPEPERLSCFCLPMDFGSSLRRSLKRSESESDPTTSSHSKSSKSSGSWRSTRSGFKSKGSESDSPDSNSRSKRFSLHFSSSSHLRSKGSDSDSISSISILPSCLRVPETEESDSANDSVQVTKLRWFRYKELEIATNCFSETNVVPHLPYKMYRGTLPSGEVVGVRRLSGVADSRFQTEVEVQSRVEHENLMCLTGFSDDQGEQLLVSEPVRNGTLDDHLHGSSGCSLPWHTRLSISLSVARAVAYLHWEQKPPLIHQDLRPRNVFLGDGFVAKVANYTSPFQCSELVALARSSEYHDPESLSQVQTEACNVYSFGVILLQLLTGKPAYDHTRKQSLVHRTRNYQHKAQDEDFQAVRPLLDLFIADQPIAELEAVWNLALQCVGKDRDGRPTMEEVVEVLESLNERWLLDSS